jgi:hypothetical protein
MYRISWLTAIFMLLAVPAFANGIGMSTSWQDMDLEPTQCLRQARVALWRSGFWQNMTTGLRSISAETSGYTATIRCLPEKQTVLFSVAGQDSEKAEELQSLISRNF